MPKVIAIAGPTSSGKSLLADMLVEKLGPGAVLYELVRDYKSVDPRRRLEPLKVDYDHAEAVDLEVSRRTIEALKKQKHEIFLNTYDFSKMSRGTKERLVLGTGKPFQRPTGPTIYLPRIDYIVVEGMFALHEDVRDVVDVAVFLDMDIESCYLKRKERDMKRGLSERDVEVLWNSKILPGYRDDVLPSRDVADLVFRDQGEVSRLALPKIFELLGANPGISYEW